MSLRRYRISIAAVMAAIAFVAVACFLLAYPTLFRASVAFTVTLGLLCYSAACSVLHGGTRRAFWIGFALFGWPHWASAFFWTRTGVSYGPPRMLHQLFGIDPIEGFLAPAPSTQVAFLQTSNSLATVGFALIGGFLVWLTVVRSEVRNERAA
jgi:hypothetical protein